MLIHCIQLHPTCVLLVNRGLEALPPVALPLPSRLFVLAVEAVRSLRGVPVEVEDERSLCTA